MQPTPELIAQLRRNPSLPPHATTSPRNQISYQSVNDPCPSGAGEVQEVLLGETRGRVRRRATERRWGRRSAEASNSSGSSADPAWLV